MRRATMPAKLASCILPKGERFEGGTIGFGSGYDGFGPVVNIGSGEAETPASDNRAKRPGLIDEVVRWARICQGNKDFHSGESHTELTCGLERFRFCGRLKH
jgi:hypothetical protein